MSSKFPQPTCFWIRLWNCLSLANSLFLLLIETSLPAPVSRLAEQPLIAEAAKLLITSTVCTLYDDLTASVPLFPFKMFSLSQLSVLALPQYGIKIVPENKLCSAFKDNASLKKRICQLIKRNSWEALQFIASIPMQFTGTSLIAAFHFPGWWNTLRRGGSQAQKKVE